MKEKELTIVEEKYPLRYLWSLVIVALFATLLVFGGLEYSALTNGGCNGALSDVLIAFGLVLILATSCILAGVFDKKESRERKVKVIEE